MQKNRALVAGALLLTVGLYGCGGSNDKNTGGGVQAPATYNFEHEGSSTVVYSGQIARNVLMKGLKAEMTALNDHTGDQATARSALDAYFVDGTEILSSSLISISTTPQRAQTYYSDLSGSANLIAKTAGNDAVTDHKDWDADNNFVGWTGAVSPQALVETWLGEIAANAADSTTRTDGEGNALTVYQTTGGLDLQQLVEKFLLGAVAYSQAMDDYLDNDPATPGKGLLADNETRQSSGAPYTALEHQWDEGYGYFGAARDLNAYSAEDLSTGYRDSDERNGIDLETEYNYPFAVYAVKRSTNEKNYAKTIFDAFRQGRAIISAADAKLTEAQMADLVAQRDIIRRNWEEVVAANIVHYINATIDDMNAAAYSYADHIKHWGEMKGFALGLQFNPVSSLEGEAFANFHNLVGDAPELDRNAFAAYEADLLKARDILQHAYGFTDDQVAAW